MRLAAFSVRNFQFTLVLFALLSAVGWHAWQKIPRGEDPHFPIPVVTVVAVYPGADPADMEKLVADPLEDAINRIDDVKDIWSDSEDGLAIVRVEFDWSKDPEKKYDEALREINAVRAELPDGLASLDITKASPGLVNILQLALVGPNGDPRAMREVAERLQDRLEQVKGIREVELWGLPEAEVQIALDLAGRLSLQGRRPGRGSRGELWRYRDGCPGGGVRHPCRADPGVRQLPQHCHRGRRDSARHHGWHDRPVLRRTDHLLHRP